MFSALIRSVALILVASIALISLQPRAARAGDVADEAEAQFNLGTERYQAGAYREALVHFLSSNRLASNRNVTFNVARCYEQLKQFPEAYRYYSSALEGETDPAAKSRTQEALDRISPSVAVLEVTSDPPGARVYLNRTDLGERGTTPLRVALPPATYRIIVELGGFKGATSEPTKVVVGGEQSVKLKLTRIVGTVRIPEPVGASVRLDADNTEVVCTTPCDVQATPGQHMILLSREGYRVAQVPVSVRADETSVIKPDLVPESGSLVVSADEPNATIEVDGVTHGFTPAILALPVGVHVVRISLRGFRPIERHIVVKTNQQTRLDVQLASADSVDAASRVTEYAETAPASVSLINTQELRAMRYPTLAEALRGVRGTYVTDDRGYQTVGFRGFGRLGAYGNRVLITIDGTPVNDDWVWSSYVGYDLRTDLDDVERIEVVRGPGSVLYGTSAFTGVVNMVSRSTDAPDGQEVGLSAAGDGVARARARINRRFGNDGGFWTSVAAGRSAGLDFYFPEYVNEGPPEVAGHARDVDGAEFATFTGRGRWKALTLSWFLHHQDKHLPTGYFETLLGDGRTRQTDTRGFVDLRIEPTFGPVTWLTRLHANTYAFRGYYARSPSTENGGLEEDPYDSNWIGAEERLIITPSPVFTITVGGEGQHHPSAVGTSLTELDGEYFRDERDFQIAAAYGGVDIRPDPAVRISAASRIDYYSTFGSSVNPRLALTLKPYAAGNLKVIAGKAFKAPSIYEMYYAALGQLPQPDLKPENIYSLELEFSHRFDNNVVATIAGYTNYITDLISLENVIGPDGGDYIQYNNANTPVGTRGFELEVRRDWKQGIMVAASYSFQQSAYLETASLSALLTMDRDPAFREVANAPSHLASVRGAVPILSRALTLMTRLSLDSGRYDRHEEAADPIAQTRTEEALLWDIVLSGVEPHTGVDYALGLYNAFDTRSAYPLSGEFRQRTIPMSGRSLLASASVKF